MSQSFWGLGSFKEKGTPPFESLLSVWEDLSFHLFMTVGQHFPKLHRAVVLSLWVVEIVMGVE